MILYNLLSILWRKQIRKAKNQKEKLLKSFFFFWSSIISVLLFRTTHCFMSIVVTSNRQESQKNEEKSKYLFFFNYLSPLQSHKQFIKHTNSFDKDNNDHVFKSVIYCLYSHLIYYQNCDEVNISHCNIIGHRLLAHN